MEKNEGKTIYLVTTQNYWGRGESLAEAMSNNDNFDLTKPFILYCFRTKNPEGIFVDEMGSACYNKDDIVVMYNEVGLQSLLPAFTLDSLLETVDYMLRYGGLNKSKQLPHHKEIDKYRDRLMMAIDKFRGDVDSYLGWEKKDEYFETKFKD